MLPDPAGADMPVVILRLRGQMSLGATFAAVLADYVERLDRVGGHLILSGVQSPMLATIERNSAGRVAGSIDIFEATEVVGASTQQAIDAGLRWLAEQDTVGDDPTDSESGRDEGVTPDASPDVTPS